MRHNADVVHGMEDEKMRDLEHERMGQYHSANVQPHYVSLVIESKSGETFFSHYIFYEGFRFSVLKWVNQRYRVC